MAVDTAAKRRSICGVRRLPWIIRRFTPAPDGTIDQGDRQSLAGVYSGIAADAPPVVTARLRMDHRFLFPRMRSV